MTMVLGVFEFEGEVDQNWSAGHSHFFLLAGLTGFSIQLTSFKFYRYFDNRTVFLATMWLIL